MAEELPSIESIYDFLYLDNTKIKSFYAQLTGSGSLSTIKATNALSTTQAKEATVGVPTITGGKLGYSQTPSRSNEYLYDAIPTMPREMIDKLDELGFISRELSLESAGKLVLLTGKLSITDVSILKDMIEPAMKQEAINKAEELSSNSKKKHYINQQINSNKNVIELIKAIPYALEARLIVNDNEVWMTLNKDEMVGNPHDINLKHGNFLFGDYYVLGVLDAVPNEIEPNFNTQNDFKLALSFMVEQLKIMLGRSNQSYGITPIAIFRVIKANSSTK